MPQTHGKVQSAVSFELSGMKSDQASPLTTPSVSQTVSNWPSDWISPMSTGFDRWWLVFITAMPPVRFLKVWPYMACRTASTSTVPACCTACTHMLKPM